MTKKKISRRRKDEKLSLEDVARYYRGGCTRMRIFQIESYGRVSPEVLSDYDDAVAAAIARREKIKNVVMRATREFCES